MKFELNTEKSPFCTIGPFCFAFGSETHDVDVGSLSDEYKKQLLYNVNRGVLIPDDRDKLIALVETIQKVTPVPQEQIPLQPVKVAERVASVIKDPIKESIKPLKALLRKTVATVKKEAAACNPSQIRRLVELEKEGKNRKSVISFLVERVEKHEMSVLDNIDTSDNDRPVIDPMSIDPMRSTQVTDIVELENEKVTFTPDDLLSQE